MFSRHHCDSLRFRDKVTVESLLTVVGAARLRRADAQSRRGDFRPPNAATSHGESSKILQLYRCDNVCRQLIVRSDCAEAGSFMSKATTVRSLTVISFLVAGPILAAAQSLSTTVPTGSYPIAVAANPATNKIYVANQNSDSVTVIDGVTNNTTTVWIGSSPNALAVNSVTNRIYVAEVNAATVTVINGANNQTSSVATGAGPWALAVNPVTNKIYVANYDAQSVTVIDGATNNTINVGVGTQPFAVAVNSVTNKIFVADSGSADVAVIDGLTNSVTTVSVGADPCAIAVNELTNQIYVADYRTNAVSVIDGMTYAVTNVAVGQYPNAIAVDPVRNQIIVVTIGTNSATIIDGVSLNTTSIPAGGSPVAVDVDAVTSKAYFANNVYDGTVTMYDEVSGAVSSVNIPNSTQALSLNPVTNTLYAAMPLDNALAVIQGAASDPLQLVTVTPCRVVDTRGPQGPFGGPHLSGGTTRSFAVPQGACSVPSFALAYSLNVTVVPRIGSLGFLTIWPTGEDQPVVSTLNSPDGRVKANAAIVPAGAAGGVSVYVSDDTDVILDIDGYFQTPTSQTLQFYPLPLCRVFDTRAANGALGGPCLYGGQERDFPVQASNCRLPPNALAYSMNFTVVPVSGQALGYLTVWPAGNQQPVVSTLNNPTATTLANAAIVPAGTNGAIAAFADQDTQLIADINGYFALPATGGPSLYSVAPCRVIDTRSSGGAFSGQRNPPVNATATSCGIADAQEFIFNATVVPAGQLGYLTLWPDGDPMPGVSTLNATDGLAASNMAIIGNVDGEVDAYAYGSTQLILDIASYFAP
jgi:YVTN family beta-propeller protein